MQIRLFAPSCGGNQFFYISAFVVMSLVAASKGGCEKNDSGGTHKVNGEFSGPDYKKHNLSHLFFRLYFLSSFLSSYFSPFQASASSQGFLFQGPLERV